MKKLDKSPIRSLKKAVSPLNGVATPDRTFKPTADERIYVKELATNLTPHESIAALIREEKGGISVETLKKHFVKELRIGKAKFDAVAGGALSLKIQQGDTGAIIFYAKTQWGWNETKTVKVEIDEKNVKELSDRELEEIIRKNG